MSTVNGRRRRHRRFLGRRWPDWCFLLVDVDGHVDVRRRRSTLSTLSTSIWTDVFITPICSDYGKKTPLLMIFWCQRQDKKNGTTFGQIGPRVPSGLIYKVFNTSQQNLLLVRSFVRSFVVRCSSLYAYLMYGGDPSPAFGPGCRQRVSQDQTNKNLCITDYI